MGVLCVLCALCWGCECYIGFFPKRACTRAMTPIPAAASTALPAPHAAAFAADTWYGCCRSSDAPPDMTKGGWATSSTIKHTTNTRTMLPTCSVAGWVSHAKLGLPALAGVAGGCVPSCVRPPMRVAGYAVIGPPSRIVGNVAPYVYPSRLRAPAGMWVGGAVVKAISPGAALVTLGNSRDGELGAAQATGTSVMPPDGANWDAVSCNARIHGSTVASTPPGVVAVATSIGGCTLGVASYIVPWRS